MGLNPFADYGQPAKWCLSSGSVAQLLKESAFVVFVFIPKVSLSLLFLG